MILGIDHIEIVVRDINEAAGFFGRMGFKELRRTEHHGGSVEMTMPGNNSLIFEFHLGVPGELPGINHIAFAVEDAAAMAGDLASAGVAFEDMPHKTSSTNRIVASFRDPMYLKWQLSQQIRSASEQTAAE